MSRILSGKGITLILMLRLYFSGLNSTYFDCPDLSPAFEMPSLAAIGDVDYPVHIFLLLVNSIAQCSQVGGCIQVSSIALLDNHGGLILPIYEDYLLGIALVVERCCDDSSAISVPWHLQIPPIAPFLTTRQLHQAIALRKWTPLSLQQTH